jgi:hypothetical protein
MRGGTLYEGEEDHEVGFDDWKRFQFNTISVHVWWTQDGLMAWIRKRRRGAYLS